MTNLFVLRRRITTAIPATAYGAHWAPLQTQSAHTISRWPVWDESAFPRLPRAQSALAMTHQAVPRCTSALARLNYPVQGAQGAPLQSDLQVGAVDGAAGNL